MRIAQIELYFRYYVNFLRAVTLLQVNSFLAMMAKYYSSSKYDNGLLAFSVPDRNVLRSLPMSSFFRLL